MALLCLFGSSFQKKMPGSTRTRSRHVLSLSLLTHVAGRSSDWLAKEVDAESEPCGQAS